MKQLNIKSEETYWLAKKLSQMTGETVTQAITIALQERIDKLSEAAKNNRQGIANQLLAIGEKCQALPMLDDRSVDEILYDEAGLPKG
jgi:antitoxin VapB